MVGKGIGRQRHTPHLPQRPQLRSAGKRLEVGIGKDRSRAKSCSAISASSLGAKFRQTAETSQFAGSEATGSMERRFKCQEVRGSCQDLSGIPSPPTEDPGLLHKDGSQVSQGGPRTFCPLSGSPPRKKKYVIELFSGCARLSRACSNVGLVTIAYDIEYGKQCDLLNGKVFSQLVRFIKRHASDIALVWMGTPCATWSRARKHGDGGPPPLRDDDANLWGFSDVSSRDWEKLQEGNALLMVSDKIAELCSRLAVPWVLENPASSRIWLTRNLQKFKQLGAFFITTDFCAFGMPWRKATGFLCFHFDGMKNISKHCCPQGGRCAFTNRRHIILTGKDSNGVWMTRRAQPYPHKLCAMIADELVHS